MTLSLSRLILARSSLASWGEFLLLLLLCLAINNQAHAQTIDQRLCQALIKHTPNADVTYQPGVDVHGKAVAPADLSGSNTFKLQDSFEIPLTVNLADRLKLRTNRLGSNSEISIGTLTVTGDKVLYNGQPLSDEQQDNLAVMCLHP